MSGASTNKLKRLLDGFNRPAGLLLDSGYPLFYGRNSESLISVISNVEFTAQYAYANGYAVRIQPAPHFEKGGRVFVRAHRKRC